jgi:hypothetical protein
VEVIRIAYGEDGGYYYRVRIIYRTIILYLPTNMLSEYKNSPTIEHFTARHCYR